MTVQPNIRSAPDAVDKVDVLVVDDEPSIRAVLSTVLKESGFSVRCAETGYAALQMLSQHHFGLVVTDIHMPDMDGLEVIMHCTAMLPGVPIVAMSGGGFHNIPEAVLRPAKLLGSKGTLIKPFSLADFMQTVKAFLPNKRGAGRCA